MSQLSYYVRKYAGVAAYKFGNNVYDYSALNSGLSRRFAGIGKYEYC